MTVHAPPLGPWSRWYERSRAMDLRPALQAIKVPATVSWAATIP